MMNELNEIAATEMTCLLDAEIMRAICAKLGEVGALDVVRRCELVRCAGDSWQYFYLDGEPILQIGPIESKTELRGDAYAVTYTRQYRHLNSTPAF